LASDSSCRKLGPGGLRGRGGGSGAGGQSMDVGDVRIEVFKGGSRRAAVVWLPASNQGPDHARMDHTISPKRYKSACDRALEIAHGHQPTSYWPPRPGLGAYCSRSTPLRNICLRVARAAPSVNRMTTKQKYQDARGNTKVHATPAQAASQPWRSERSCRCARRWPSTDRHGHRIPIRRGPRIGDWKVVEPRI